MNSIEKQLTEEFDKSEARRNLEAAKAIIERTRKNTAGEFNKSEAIANKIERDFDEAEAVTRLLAAKASFERVKNMIG
jgi:hypothetical protein